MVRWLAAVTLALLLTIAPSAALGSPLTDGLAALRAALQARAADVATPAVEARHLRAADTALGGMDGDLDAADLRALARAGTSLGRSRTSNAGVLSAATAFAGLLADEAEAQADALEALIPSVFSSRTRVQYQAAVNAARAAVTRAQAQLAADPVGAIRRLRGALATLVRTSARLRALVARTTTNGVLQYYNLSLVHNPTSSPVVITGVAVNVRVTPETGEPFVLSGNVSSSVPAGSAYRLPYTVNPGSFFYNYRNAVGYAVYARIGDTPYRLDGVIRLILRRHPPTDVVVADSGT